MPDELAPLDLASLNNRQLLVLGIEQFNQQQFYQAHETLELLWNRQTNPTDPNDRQLTQGILQIAVGYYHWLERNNLTGARNKLSEGLEKIANLPPHYLQEQQLDCADLFQHIPSQVHQLQTLATTQQALPTCETLPQIRPIH